MLELGIYLDTHPDSCGRISYFNQIGAEARTALKVFAANFEPLTVDCISKNGGLSDHFTWLDGPAPWEGGAL